MLPPPPAGSRAPGRRPRVVELASVTSLSALPTFRPDFRARISEVIRAARESLHLDHEEFAGYLRDVLGLQVTAGTIARWEDGAIPPADVFIIAGMAAQGTRRQRHPGP